MIYVSRLPQFQDVIGTQLRIEGNSQGNEWKRSIEYIVFLPVHTGTFKGVLDENNWQFASIDSN